MRRVFQDEFGVSPSNIWQTQRLLLAKQLLTDSRLSVSSVALASGLELRRFNSPQRTLSSDADGASQTTIQAKSESYLNFRLRLGYRPPLAWEQILDFLSCRAIPQVEAVQDCGISSYGSMN